MLILNRLLDKDLQSPRLTLPQDVAPLIDRFDGKEMPAVLFYYGELEGSGIALKGTEGGKLALTPEY